MFEPRPVEMVLEGGLWRATSKPYITLVSTRLLNQGATEAALSIWGYRPVEYMEIRPAILFVRPLPLWLIVKGKERVRTGLINLVRWAFRHGLVHLACSEGVLPRWSDWRLGPGGER